MRNAYDDQGQVVEQIDPPGRSPAFVYDGDHNLIEQINATNKSTMFTYDAQHRLRETTDELGHQDFLDFDAEHHLTRQRDHLLNEVVTTYLPDGLVDTVTDPRLTVTDHGYDANGFLDTAQTGAHPVIDWDFNNRGFLASLTDQEGATTSFLYDGVGNRLKAIRGGIETQYVYDAAGNLLAEANGAGQITRYYIYGAGLAALVTNGETFVYHFDGTGHTVAMTSQSNQTVNRYAYSPYGEVLGEQEQIGQPFKYAGQVGIFTEDDNLYYMRARYYDAETGRFISEDPIGFVDGTNLYAYVGGNPINATDPSGLVCGTGVCVVGTVVVAGGVSGVGSQLAAC